MTFAMRLGIYSQAVRWFILQSFFTHSFN